MNLIEKIKERVLKFLGLEHLSQSPTNPRFTFLFNVDEVRRQKLQEYKTWYIGDSDELLNLYTAYSVYGFYKDPIYNRNARNYFWSISSEEGAIKRTHSGVPNAIITTLTNIIGAPKVISDNEETILRLNYLLEQNDFQNMLNQQQMPLTMVEGWGAFKIDIDTTISDTPIVTYYEAEDVEFIYKANRLLGIIYKDYYRKDDKNYVLLETRRVANRDSYIEYELFELTQSNEVVEAKPADLEEIPELAKLPKTGIVIKGLNKVIGVPCKFFFDPNNKNYGRSVFTGKLDQFDNLDQCLSQASQTVRVSTPVEYYNSEILERDKNGNPSMPSVFNRQYIARPATFSDGDGSSKSNDIQTTQPILNFDQYSREARAILDFILIGILSPATMGIDISKKDNADAQREKEKITIMTRNNIIVRETIIIRQLCTLLLQLDEYMHTGEIDLDKKYDLGVNYDEFANPSFENEISILGNAWNRGQISTEKYVTLLWGDKLSQQEKEIEISELEKFRSQDDLNMEQIMNGGQNNDRYANGTANDQSEEGTDTDTTKVSEE